MEKQFQDPEGKDQRQMSEEGLEDFVQRQTIKRGERAKADDMLQTTDSRTGDENYRVTQIEDGGTNKMGRSGPGPHGNHGEEAGGIAYTLDQVPSTGTWIHISIVYDGFKRVNNDKCNIMSGSS